jgi:hypothetical protein
MAMHLVLKKNSFSTQFLLRTEGILSIGKFSQRDLHGGMDS